MTATASERDDRRARRAMPDWLRRIRWQLLAIALVFGGIVHILATLVVPRLTTASAWHRLAPKLPVNRMVVQPLATPGTQPLPFIGPDTRFAFCRYDLSQGPMVLTATLPEKGWSIGLYSTDGDNFFSITAQEQRRTDVRLTLTPPAERLLGIFNWGRSVDATLSDVVVPRVEGLVVIRAPIRGRAYQSETEAVLGSARCTPRG